MRNVIPRNEHILAALKGTFKEYLICTDKSVHIIKKGFMTGHTFGNGDFKMPYANVTNAEVDFHVLSGYFELSSGGLQNKRYNFWSNDAEDDPCKQPNVISLNSSAEAALFRKAADFIMEKAAEAKQPQVVYEQQPENAFSAADEIRKYKELLDMGAITQEEFEAKKEQLLNL
ncbi:MAG: SHOCT domain-containing protein [Eubacteriales bacterium]|nr:SHOCT domain-containing protein [Eubacteriales bacterium]